MVLHTNFADCQKGFHVASLVDIPIELVEDHSRSQTDQYAGFSRKKIDYAAVAAFAASCRTQPAAASFAAECLPAGSGLPAGLEKSGSVKFGY